MVEQLNDEGIEFPVATKHFGKIEEQNSININVFGYENKQFYPSYISKQHNEDVLNLLLMAKDEKKHYVLIKESDSLMFNKTKHKNKKRFCMHCLQRFSIDEIMSNHKVNCMVINGEQAIRMPQKGKNTLQFQNHHSCRYLSLFMPILRSLQKEYKGVSLIICIIYRQISKTYWLQLWLQSCLLLR